MPLACIALGSVVLWFVAPRLPRIDSLTIALLMVTLSSSVVAIYYTAPLLVIAAMILRDPAFKSRLGARRGALDGQPTVGRLLPAATAVGTALILAPVVIPTSSPLFVVGIHAEFAGWIVGLYQIWLGPMILSLFLLLLAYTPVVARRLRRQPAEQLLLTRALQQDTHRAADVADLT